MLPLVAVDPSMVWVIEQSDSVTTARNSITAVMKWTSSNVSSPLSTALSRRSITAITGLGLFPAESHLSEVLDKIGLKGIVSAKSIASNISRFLSTSRYLEDESGCEDAIIESVSVDPFLFANINNGDLVGASLDAIAFAGLNAKLRGCADIYALPRMSEDLVEAKVSGIVEAVQTDDDSNYKPGELKSDHRVIRDPEGWYRGLSAEAVWRSAIDREEVELAIWLKVNETIIATGGGYKHFRVGTEFLGSLHACQAAPGSTFSDVAFGKCVLSVLTDSSLDAQPFRVSEKSNSAVRTRSRDKAKAWRLHVTGGHEALRLMYWECADGSIELATIGPKFELVIAEGAVLPARRW